jgi:hypothetical protein
MKKLVPHLFNNLSASIFCLGALAAAILIPAVSSAQDTRCGDATIEYQSCSGGISCSGLVRGEVADNSGDGTYWTPQKFMCPTGFGCSVTVWQTDGNGCIGTELRKKETRDQLAELASSRNVIIADCQGYYRQYRKPSPAVPAGINVEASR